MSKMNFKSTLWALAFACAAVSCSDELADGPNNNNESEEQGEGVYLTVNIASPSGTTTKAPGDGGWSAEDGDDFEQGTATERMVNDINIYLIEAASGTGAINGSESGLSVVNADGGTKIVGHGFSTTVLENGYDASIHHTANTVRLTVNEVPSAATVYHVLAVANFGKEVNFVTLGELRDAVKVTTEGADWTGNAFTTSGQTVGLASETKKFVMSTHQMWDETLHVGSSVTISPENMDETNPAQATVFIERLAARIDLGLTEALVGQGDGNTNGEAVEHPIKVEGSTKSNDNAKDYVKLTGYQVVNRWNGDNYLLKRVTAELTGTGTAYPSIGESFTISYLGDEVWNNTTHKFNYVIDPFTAGTAPKNSKNISTYENSYESHYDEDLNTNISTQFRGLSGEGSDNISTTDGQFTPVFYTKENCLDLNNQIMGLVTGIIFQGKYTPNAVSKFYQNGGDNSTAVVKADNYSENADFYVVNDFSDGDASRFLTSDLTTIGALSFTDIANDAAKTYSSDLLKALFGTAGSWGSVTLDNLKEAVNAMVGGKLNMEYKAYLQKLITPASGEAPKDINGIQLRAAKWSAFLESDGIKITDPSTVTTGTDAYARSSKDLYDKWNISYYKGGVCYFPYWIRHENNNNNAVLGPMEFCIVRNNVYQVGVTGVNALGYPLPFVTPEDTPVEQEEVFLQVQIYVKDWTLRKNSGIIL